MRGYDDSTLLDALRGLPGVHAAAAAADGSDGLALDVHLRAGADEVAVATAVTRMLREHFGLVVGGDRVRVLSPVHLQFRPAPGEGERFTGDHVSVPRPRQGRAARTRRDDPVVRVDRAVLEVVEVDTTDEPATATVRLGSWSGAHVGRVAAADPAEEAVLQAVAAAALRALESFTGQRARFTVEHVDVSDAGGHRTVLAVVTMHSERVAHLRLPGVALVRGNVHDAVVRATLAAVNRQVELLLVD